MRSSRNRFADPPDSTARPATGRRWANGLPVLPLRLFLAALFCFAGYAKLSYPGFFDPAPDPVPIPRLLIGPSDLEPVR